MSATAVDVLGLDCAAASCSAVLARDGVVVAERWARLDRGQGNLLPVFVAEVMAGGRPDCVAVSVGPGSFTGIRAGLALALGLAAGWGCALRGYSVPDMLVEAVRTGAATTRTDWPLWIALRSRRGHVFLAESGAEVHSTNLGTLPIVAGPIRLVGDAAVAVAAVLAGRGGTVQLCHSHEAPARSLTALALAGPGRAVQPLYVEPPQARPVG